MQVILLQIGYFERRLSKRFKISVCHSHVPVCHAYVTRMYSYVICMSVVCTRMSPVCYSYVLVVICMSLVCTRMSSVSHSYVLEYHPYVTRMYSYVIRMSLVCGFTMNIYVTRLVKHIFDIKTKIKKQLPRFLIHILIYETNIKTASF